MSSRMKITCGFLIAAIGLAGWTGTALAVDLNNNPYVPKLRPSGPMINTPGVKRSGSYRTDEGVIIHQNGQRTENRSTGRQRYTPGAQPSINHQQWCANRFRSYRTSDNTYQPMVGARAACNSPFQ